MELSDYTQSETRVQVFTLSIESPFKWIELSVETLVKGINFVVTEVGEFEHRDDSIVLAFLVISDGRIQIIS